MAKLFTGKKLPKGTYRYIPEHHEMINGKTIRSGEYECYRSMLFRCYYFSNPKYIHYSGKGVKVDTRYTGPDGFYNWLADMGPKPFQEATVNRKDSEGHYTKENMEWADRTTQSIETKRISTRNTSGYRGVSFDPKKNRWVAQVKLRGQLVYRRYCYSKVAAAKAYNEAAVKYHGKSARLNEIILGG